MFILVGDHRPSEANLRALLARGRLSSDSARDLERAAREIRANLSKPRRPKATTQAAQLTRPSPIGPEACHASGNQVHQGSLQAAFHAICHKLAGRCVNIYIGDLDGKTGDCTRVGNRFTIRVSDSLTGTAPIRTLLHELGHVEVFDLSGRDSSEDEANAWRDHWVDQAEREALARFGDCKPESLIKAILED